MELLVEKLIRTKFTVGGLLVDDLGKYLHFGLPFDRVWIKRDELLLMKEENTNGLAVYVINKVEQKKPMTDDKYIQLGIDRSVVSVQSFLQICTLLTTAQPSISLLHEETKIINSIDEVHLNDRHPLKIEVKYPENSIPSSEEIKQVGNYLTILLQKAKVLYVKYSPYLFDMPFLRLAGQFLQIARSKMVEDIFRFVSSVGCLEALFNDSPVDIKYKLQLRCSFLLGLIDSTAWPGKAKNLANSERIFEMIGENYRARNEFLHGIYREKPRTINIEEMIEYARISVICFYILCARNSEIRKKDKLLYLIDRSAINSVYEESLKKQIGEGIEEFKIEGLLNRV